MATKQFKMLEEPIRRIKKILTNNGTEQWYQGSKGHRSIIYKEGKKK